MVPAGHEHSGLMYRFKSSYWVSGAWSRAAAHTHTHTCTPKQAGRPARTIMHAQAGLRPKSGLRKHRVRCGWEASRSQGHRMHTNEVCLRWLSSQQEMAERLSANTTEPRRPRTPTMVEPEPNKQIHTRRTPESHRKPHASVDLLKEPPSASATATMRALPTLGPTSMRRSRHHPRTYANSPHRTFRKQNMPHASKHRGQTPSYRTAPKQATASEIRTRTGIQGSNAKRPSTDRSHAEAMPNNTSKKGRASSEREAANENDPKSNLHRQFGTM